MNDGLGPSTSTVGTAEKLANKKGEGFMRLWNGKKKYDRCIACGEPLVNKRFEGQKVCDNCKARILENRRHNKEHKNLKRCVVCGGPLPKGKSVHCSNKCRAIWEAVWEDEHHEQRLAASKEHNKFRRTGRRTGWKPNFENLHADMRRAKARGLSYGYYMAMKMN